MFDDLAVYNGTKNSIKIKVYDVVGVAESRNDLEKRKAKKSKPAAAVLIGTVGDAHGDGIRFDGEKLLDHEDYVMDGAEEQKPLAVDMFFLTNDGKKKNTPEKREYAGTMKLHLQYVPNRSVMSRAASRITETWYYESTVLMMVFIAMVSLALDSPADPPSATVNGALRIMELFVATQLLTELVLDVQVALAKGRLLFWKDAWFIIAATVVGCKWSSILMSRTGLVGAGSMFEQLISVGRVLRILRPMQTLRMINHVDIVASVIEESVDIFLTVAMLLVFLLSLFALIGVSSFGGVLQFECIDGEVCSAGQMEMAHERGISCPMECPSTLQCAQDGEVMCAPLAKLRTGEANAISMP
eukprot:SAG22_NODE_190_length_15715_cov_21.164980_3_plen_357_part_00